MCPLCLATLGLWVGAVASAGAATASLFRPKRKGRSDERNEKDLAHTTSWVRHHDR